uniref:transposase n=1 Tax=Marinobacterium profundum TaxID=1714300 RepID=UPI000836B92A|nr:transposase [Marinobacterium profundum]
MMTLLSVSEAPRKRRRYTPEFKARIIAACQEPAATSPAFVSLAVPAQPDQQTATGLTDSIRIEIPHTAGNVVVNWPVAQGDRCLSWLQELLR